MKTSLLKQLRDEVQGTPPPPGWYTLSQLMEKLGSKRTSMENFAIQKGWECRKFRTITSDGRSLNVKHYNVGKL